MINSRFELRCISFVDYSRSLTNSKSQCTHRVGTILVRCTRVQMALKMECIQFNPMESTVVNVAASRVSLITMAEPIS
jgi:hypothetical protein